MSVREQPARWGIIVRWGNETPMPLSKRFISLGDLYVAYRKAKVEAYYENTHFQALAFTEYEQNLHRNLERLH